MVAGWLSGAFGAGGACGVLNTTPPSRMSIAGVQAFRPALRAGVKRRTTSGSHWPGAIYSHSLGTFGRRVHLETGRAPEAGRHEMAPKCANPAVLTGRDSDVRRSS